MLSLNYSWLDFWFYAIPSSMTVGSLGCCFSAVWIFEKILQHPSIAISISFIFIFDSFFVGSVLYSYSLLPLLFLIPIHTLIDSPSPLYVCVCGCVVFLQFLRNFLTSLFFERKLEKGGDLNNKRNSQMYETKQIFKNFSIKTFN